MCYLLKNSWTAYLRLDFPHCYILWKPSNSKSTSHVNDQHAQHPKIWPASNCSFVSTFRLKYRSEIQPIFRLLNASPWQQRSAPSLMLRSARNTVSQTPSALTLQETTHLTQWNRWHSAQLLSLTLRYSSAKMKTSSCRSNPPSHLFSIQKQWCHGCFMPFGYYGLVYTWY